MNGVEGNTTRTVANFVGAERLLFGGGSPVLTHGALDHTEWVRAFTAPPSESMSQALSDRGPPPFRGGTALRLLGMAP